MRFAWGVVALMFVFIAVLFLTPSYSSPKASDQQNGVGSIFTFGESDSADPQFMEGIITDRNDRCPSRVADKPGDLWYRPGERFGCETTI
jgi:hypothetical protein